MIEKKSSELLRLMLFGGRSLLDGNSPTRSLVAMPVLPGIT
jgi:hypothetical protein